MASNIADGLYYSGTIKKALKIAREECEEGMKNASGSLDSRIKEPVLRVCSDALETYEIAIIKALNRLSGYQKP